MQCKGHDLAFDDFDREKSKEGVQVDLSDNAKREVLMQMGDKYYGLMGSENLVPSRRLNFLQFIGNSTAYCMNAARLARYNKDWVVENAKMKADQAEIETQNKLLQEQIKQMQDVMAKQQDPPVEVSCPV